MHGRLLGVPDLLEVAVLALELADVPVEVDQSLLRGVVRLPRQRLALDLELDQAPLEPIELLGLRIDLHADVRGRLVDQVDRLVGQLTVRDVAVREGRRRDDRGIGDLDAVVHLVALLEPSEDRDGVLHARLVDEDLLEAALEGGVLLDVLAVLVERGRADAVQLAAGERGLQHVARVHRALGLAGADHGVDLVDEQDDLPFLLGKVRQHRLQPLLELAAELGARDQRAHVEREHALVLDPLGHLAVDDALGEPLDQGGLAHARLADDDGVVLGAPLQHLDGAADLVVAADDRVDLALLGAGGQVDRELLERLPVLLGVLVGDRAALHLLDRLLDGRKVRPVGEHQLGERVLLVLERSEHEDLGGDVLIPPLLRLLVGQVQEAVELARDVQLPAAALDLRQSVERTVEPGPEPVDVDARLREQRPDAAAVLIEHGHHQVHRLDELVIPPEGEGLCVLECQLELAGQLVHSHESYLLLARPRTRPTRRHASRGACFRCLECGVGGRRINVSRASSALLSAASRGPRARIGVPGPSPPLARCACRELPIRECCTTLSYMSKTQVYSWRLDDGLKSALEQAARDSDTSVASLLEEIVTSWLAEREDAEDDAERQERHARKRPGLTPAASRAVIPI